MSKRQTRARWLLTIGCGLLFISTHVDAKAQGIRAQEVLGPARIKVTISAGAGSRRRRTPPSRAFTYRTEKPFVKAPPTPQMEIAQVGFTIWKLPDGARELTQVNSEANESMEQIESTTPLTIGSRVRLGIESVSRDGYLYVIDREQFADGSYGTPSLIFPTLRTRLGNNAVKVNQLVYIPRPPSYFQISPSKTGKAQVAEVLTILLSPKPIDLPGPITDKPLALTNDMVKQWEAAWGAQANRLELNGGAGTRIQARAQQADGSKSLDQKEDEAEPLSDVDPPPQTVFRAAIKQGNPLLVTVPLRFEKTPVPKQ